MAFLTISGFSVPVLSGSADLSEQEIGTSIRAFSGHLLQTTRARARVFKGKTPILSIADSKALVGLLKSDGHHFAFADQYSSKGAGPTFGVYTISGGEITVASDESAVFDTNIGSAWTIVAYDLANTDVYTLDSNGVDYLNGSATSGVSNLFGVSSGDLQLFGIDILGNPAAMTWDWVSLYPFVFTTAMHEAISNYASGSELPSIEVSGDAVKNEIVTMRLRHGSLSEEQVQYMSGGSITTGFQVSFTLEEVI